MKTALSKHTLTIVIIMMLLIPPASATVIDDISTAISNTISSIKNSIRTATLTGYTQNVPVQIGFNPSTNYWILTGTVGWTKDTLYTFKLPAGAQSGDKKAQRNNVITIDPLGSYEKAPVTRQDLIFCTNGWASGCGLGSNYGQGAGRSAAYKVETGAWLTKTIYDIDLNGVTTNVEVGMGSGAQTNLNRGFFVQNLGILSNGANFPGGNWVYIFNPDNGEYEIYDTISIQNAIAYWNTNGVPSWSAATYNDMWQWLKARGRLPSKPVLTATAVTGIVENGDYKFIKLTYPRTAQSSVVAVYIPSTEADTITIVIGGSKAVLVGTSTITRVTSGQDARLTVVVKNTGGNDYISIKPTSNYYIFTAIGDDTKYLRTGEQATFLFSARALFQNQNCNNCALINILADGTDPSSGDATQKIYGTIDGAQSSVTPGATAQPTPQPPQPPGEDYTWMFWLLVTALIGLFAWQFKLFLNPLFWIILTLLVIAYMILLGVYELKSSIDAVEQKGVWGLLFG